MSSQRKRLPGENVHGVLRVDVEPQDHKNKSAFRRFKKWLIEVLDRNPEAEQLAREYIDAAVSDQMSKLQRAEIENRKMEQEVEFRLRQNQLSEAELRKKSLFESHELDLLKAQAEKIRAETEAVSADTRLKVLEKLDALGVDVTPIVDNKKLIGMYISGKKHIDK